MRVTRQLNGTQTGLVTQKATRSEAILVADTEGLARSRVNLYRSPNPLLFLGFLPLDGILLLECERDWGETNHDRLLAATTPANSTL